MKSLESITDENLTDLSMTNVLEYAKILKQGYKRLKEREYKDAVDCFSKVNNVPLIGATIGAILREMKNNIHIMKKMMGDGKVTAQEYREVISSYGEQYKYAKNKEETVYNKIKNMHSPDKTQERIKEINMKSKGQHFTITY